MRRPLRDVHFVDFNWPDKIERRRIKRSGEALDASVDRLVRDVDFAL